MELREQLIALEQEFWRAAGNRGRYQRQLAADAIHVFPGIGLVEYGDVLDGVVSAQPWECFEIVDPQIVELTADSAALVYRAHALRAGTPAYDAAITSVYRRRSPSWELVLHQQTPIP